MQMDWIIVWVEDDDGNLQVNMVISILISMVVDGDWCEDIMSIGSMVVGFVGVVGGGVFSLVSLFCG